MHSINSFVQRYTVWGLDSGKKEHKQRHAIYFALDLCGLVVTLGLHYSTHVEFNPYTAIATKLNQTYL